jgi:N-acetylglucosaminyl-diphospho-decaprenol L-rhamnosyltransferase
MISVVVVNWNSGSLLGNCIRSLQNHAAGCNIVVVDNASTDASLSGIPETANNIALIHNSSNRGFAGACNQGWRHAQTEPILFLNPDTECFPGSIDLLEQTLVQNDTVWAVGGSLVAPDGRPQPDFNVRPFPTIGNVAAEVFFIDELFGVFRSKRNSLPAVSGPAVDVEQPAAACLMTRRSALASIGGFDESFYPAWFEDVDLCLRMRRSGGRIQYHPEARFLHRGGYSLEKMPGEDFLKYFHRNQIRYFRKHRGLPAALFVQKLVVAGLFLRMLLSLMYPLVRDRSRLQSTAVFRKALGAILLSKVT